MESRSHSRRKRCGRWRNRLNSFDLQRAGVTVERTCQTGVERMPGELCTLATFSDVVEASLVVNRLKDEGIPARLSSDMSGGLFGLGYALGGMDIIVNEDDLERAQVIVEKLMAEREEPWERDALPAGALPVTVDPDDPERRWAVQTARGAP